MKEAVGNSFIYGMVAAILGVIMIFFVGSISYSKAYKVKNRIINLIEESGEWNDIIKKDVDEYLKEVGYQVGAGNGKECSDYKNNSGTVLYESEKGFGYNYCVIKYCSGNYNLSNNQIQCLSGGSYYKVVTFMRFEFPVIGSFVEFPVSGETKTFGYFNGNN